MMRSMYSGVSGLQSHQLKMDVIGNNIANVNTVGYKSQRVTFSEAYAQTLQNAAGASDATGRGGMNPMQVGLGVNVSSIDTLMTQGAAQRTDNPFDLMIVGDGFIPVSDGTGTYFTRAGAIRQDNEGNLVISNGMKVQGWPANDDGTDINRGMVQDINLGDAYNTTTPPSQTSRVSISGNLNMEDGEVKTSVKLYDSLGNLYTIPMEAVYDDENQSWTFGLDSDAETVNVGGEEYVKITDSNGNDKYIPVADITEGIEMTFTESGQLATIDGQAVDEKNADTLLAGIFSGGNGEIYDLEVDDDGDIVGVNKLKSTFNQDAKINFDGLTQYSAKSSVNSRIQDGSAAGEMMGYAIGPDGKITAYYTNGDEKLLGQIVVAQFDNQAGLQKVGDNLFSTTPNSGDFDSIGQEGSFQTGVLEMSNVDLSSEFTDMIVTQRGFQANSRIISVSDEMLQELVNMKR